MLGHMFRRHSLAATSLSVVIVGALVLAACSSDSSKPIAKANSSAIAPPTSVTTAPPSTSGSCGARAGAIDAAIQGGHLGPVPIAKYTISDCRIAASNQTFSAVTLVPNPGSGVVQLLPTRA